MTPLTLYVKKYIDDNMYVLIMKILYNGSEKRYIEQLVNVPTSLLEVPVIIVYDKYREIFTGYKTLGALDTDVITL